MHRLSLLFVALVVGSTLAAPAPLPRVDDWTTGWDKPIDPLGDCSFGRKGDKLTITVPGKGHGLDVREGRLNAPRLLRDVEGDFIVQVRVSGDFGPHKGPNGDRRVGLLLLGGEADDVVRIQLAVSATVPPRRLCNFLAEISRKGGGPALRVGTYEGPAVGATAWLRLERRGGVGRMAFREHGKEWVQIRVPLEMKLPRKLKVGVVAEATGEGTFKVEFSELRLTSLKK
jgi:Protein of unknown function (DUF1349)